MLPVRLNCEDGMNYTDNGFNSLWRKTIFKARELEPGRKVRRWESEQ